MHMKTEKKTFWSFIWTLWYAYKENRDMNNCISDHIMGHCETISIPSKRFRIKHGINMESQNLHVWAILEKYVNGDLVEKDKHVVVSGIDVKEHKNTNQTSTI